MQLRIAAAAAAALIAAPAHADLVSDWVEFGDRVAEASPPPPNTPRDPERERMGTQLRLAMFEAANAADLRYESYVGLKPARRGANGHAAVLSAARSVLIALHPGQQQTVDENYRVALAAWPDDANRREGVAVGEAAAKLALATGKVDPKIVQNFYRPSATAGRYIAAALPVIEPHQIAIKPWAIDSVEAVRPPPPPALTSARYARDLEEVKRLGGRNSKERTPEQSLMARYRITPDVAPSLRAVADLPGRTLVQNARMYALVEMALDDSYMATLAAKLHYDFWRPVTAIRNAEDDGNPATVPDKGWLPFTNTPNHPEYPCGHCTYAASVAEVMKAEAGAAPPGGVRVASRSLPLAAVQTLPDWDTWVKEVSFSRTLGGVHYRFANEAGEKVGRDAARIVMSRVMKPR